MDEERREQDSLFVFNSIQINAERHPTSLIRKALTKTPYVLIISAGITSILHKQVIRALTVKYVHLISKRHVQMEGLNIYIFFLRFFVVVLFRFFFSFVILTGLSTILFVYLQCISVPPRL